MTEPRIGGHSSGVERGETWMWLLAALGVLVATVQTLRLQRARAFSGRRARERAVVARRGELDAELLLRSAGYRIEQRQAPGTMRIYVDGEPVDVGLRADLLVVRRRRRFVAEVKTGDLAPRIEHGNTRRQLLEYLLAFDVDGVLLVDPQQESIRQIALEPGPRRRAARTSRWILGLALVAGAWAWLLTH